MGYPRWLPILLGFLQAVGPVSIDMYLPAFPAIEASLHAPAGGAQFTLGTWILGLACGQLLQGALSDRFGRRVPLLIGTALYTAASAGCAMAPSIAWLATWRFVAAVGGSASMIVPRAVVRDIAEGHEAARLMSRLILVLGVAPVLAPSLGGLVLRFANWRDIFWIMAGYGALATILATWLLPDTLHATRRTNLHLATMLQRWFAILTERAFITHALIVAACAFALFAFLGGSPTVFIEQYHLSPAAYGALFGCVSVVYIACSQLNVVITRRLGLGRTLSIITSVYLGMALLVVVAAVTGAGGPLALAFCLAFTQGLAGFMVPTATVGALTRHAAHAGSASAVLGTLQFVIGCSSGFLIAVLTNGTALPMAGLMLLGALGAKIADLARPGAKTESASF
jgi:DHA1 family bicyclomycin/chloramphenicol resistance-like MFS transporter